MDRLLLHLAVLRGSQPVPVLPRWVRPPGHQPSTSEAKTKAAVRRLGEGRYYISDEPRVATASRPNFHRLFPTIFRRRRQPEIREVIEHVRVRPVLLVDLQDPAVLVIRRRDDPRLLPRQKDGGVGAVPVDQAADDDHAGQHRPDRFFRQ